MHILPNCFHHVRVHRTMNDAGRNDITPSSTGLGEQNITGAQLARVVYNNTSYDSSNHTIYPTLHVYFHFTQRAPGHEKRRRAFPANTASIASCSMPSSANDSRASSYQSLTFDVACAAVDGEDPKTMRWNPNASTAGLTTDRGNSGQPSRRYTLHESRDSLYILIRFFHSVRSLGASGEGVGTPQAGGR